MTEDRIRHAVTVPASREDVFRVFTEGFAGWWPREYTWAGEVLDTIGIEQREGGKCYELGPHGFRCDWGRVIAWEPPVRIVLRWQISPHRTPEPNPEKASDVEVRFTEVGPSSTRIDLEHRDFERHGEGAAAYRAGMGSPEGWAYILDRFAAAV